jgi:predicted nucleic-acid-binding protein
MKRLMVLGAALVMGVTLVGCGSDPRKGLVDGTVENLQNAATKVANINKKIDEAVKKTESGKTPDFKDAIQEVESLKDIAKKMRTLKTETEALKEKTPEEEQKALRETIRGPLNDAIERLSKAKRDLNDTLAAVEQEHKDALKTVREKLTEAEGEFEAIARR